MTVDLNGLIEKFPYLNRDWVMKKANEGVIPHARPHYRKFLFDPDEVEKCLMKKFKKDSDEELDRIVADEMLRGKKRK
jgi:hypothetical protein